MLRQVLGDIRVDELVAEDDGSFHPSFDEGPSNGGCGHERRDGKPPLPVAYPAAGLGRHRVLQGDRRK